MSKRSAYGLPQNHGKKAKLDISHTDHHLPLSQNISNNNKDINCDVWGDDDDEQMLLQASQACEEEQINDTSILPDYSTWTYPASTSTQYQPSSSTSKVPFQFKKPSSHLPRSISTDLKNKCNTISSPLPGISTMSRDRHTNLSDNLGINDKILSGQNSDICRQMLLLEEEKNKLKSEFGKLSDKLATKEGEASILRSQLRASQIAIDNARMEKIRAQEKVQMESNEKLTAIAKENQSLKAQLEFKDLEVLSEKDKIKKLEAKLRQSQANDISSHRLTNTLTGPYNAMTQQKRAKLTSNGVQTENKAPFLKLNKSCGKGATGAGLHNNSTSWSLAICNTSNGTLEDKQLLEELQKLQRELEALEQTCLSFRDSGQQEPATSVLTVYGYQLLEEQPLYEGERGVAARRTLARAQAGGRMSDILDTALRICHLIEKTSSAVPYSGFLYSLLTFVSTLCDVEALKPKIYSIVKAIVVTKPMPFVTIELLSFITNKSLINNVLPSFCPAGEKGKQLMDVDQEMNNSEPCYVAMLLKRMEEMLGGSQTGDCVHTATVALRLLQTGRHSASCRCACACAGAGARARALRAAAAARARAPAKLQQKLLAACRSGLRLMYRSPTDVDTHEGLLSDAVHLLHAADPRPCELIDLRNSFQAAPEDTPQSYLQLPFMSSFASFSMTD